MSIHADKRPPAGTHRAARSLVRWWIAVVTSALLFSGAALWDTIRVRLFDVPDRAAFEAYLDETGQRATFHRLTQFLVARGVGDVVPAWQLWRQGVDWRALGVSPFAVPPQESWGHLVPTLVVVRDLVIPMVGAVDVVSGYRTKASVISPATRRKCSVCRGGPRRGFRRLEPALSGTRWQRNALAESCEQVRRALTEKALGGGRSVRSI